MLYVLRVGCPWRDMHERYGKWSSVYVRFRRWAGQGVCDALLETLVELGPPSPTSATGRELTNAGAVNEPAAQFLCRVNAPLGFSQHPKRDGWAKPLFEQPLMGRRVVGVDEGLMALLEL